MGVRYVNNANPKQDGVDTFSSIQGAINNSASGDTVVLEDNKTYNERVTLKDGVDLVCRNGIATIQVDSDVNGPAVGDNNVAVSCSLHNINAIRNAVSGAPTTAHGLYVQNASTVIRCMNSRFRSSVSHGVLNAGTIYDAEGISSETNGFYNDTGGIANRCRGFALTGSGAVSGGYGFFNIGSAFFCYGESAGAQIGFQNYGILADHCIGIHTGAVVQNGFENSSQNGFTYVPVASHCFGFSPNGYGLTCQNSSGVPGAETSLVQNCVGVSTANAGVRIGTSGRMQGGGGYSDALYGIYVQSGVAEGARGYSKSSYGVYVEAVAVAINCTADSAADSPLFVNGGKAIGCKAHTVVNGKSAVQCTASSVLIGGDYSSGASGGTIISANNIYCIGGSYANHTDNATGYVFRLLTAQAVNNGMKLIGCQVFVKNAGANAIFADNANSHVEYINLAVKGGAALTNGGNVVQDAAGVPDAQGNTYTA